MDELFNRLPYLPVKKINPNDPLSDDRLQVLWVSYVKKKNHVDRQTTEFLCNNRQHTESTKQKRNNLIVAQGMK
jgi:hypothetical protein